jgi:hypothetical protein
LLLLLLFRFEGDFFLIPSSALTIRFKMSFVDGREGAAEVVVVVVVVVGDAEEEGRKGLVGVWLEIGAGGAEEKNCGDGGGRVTGVVVNEGDRGGG